MLEIKSFFKKLLKIPLFSLKTLFILMPQIVSSGTVFQIGNGNTTLKSFNTETGAFSTVETLTFYSSGQIVFDSLQNEITILNGSSKDIIKYDLDANSSSNLSVTNDSSELQSVFGIKEDGTYVAKTDDFSEDKSTAKRFATIDKTSGALSRVGSALVTGSAYPKGNQFYSQVTNKIYTISNDSNSLLSIVDLTTNTHANCFKIHGKVSLKKATI